MFLDLQAAQSAFEAEGRSLQANLTEAVQSGRIGAVEAAERVVQFQDHVVSSWWELGEDLLFRWADGARNVGPQRLGESGTSADTGYDAWWLKAVGYSDGPGTKEDTWELAYV